MLKHLSFCNSNVNCVFGLRVNSSSKWLKENSNALGLLFYKYANTKAHYAEQIEQPFVGNSMPL